MSKQTTNNVERSFWYCEKLQLLNVGVFDSLEDLKRAIIAEKSSLGCFMIYASKWDLSACYFNALGFCSTADGGFIDSMTFEFNDDELVAIPDEDWKYCDQQRLNNLAYTFSGDGKLLPSDHEGGQWTMFGEGNTFFIPDMEVLDRIQELFGKRYINTFPDTQLVPQMLLDQA